MFARDRRFDHLYGIETGGPKTVPDFVDRRLAERIVSDNTASYQPFSDLELGFDEGDQVGPWLGEGGESLSHRAERDERQVGHNQIELATETGGGGPANVKSLKDGDTLIASEFRSQLVPADIYGDDPSRASLQKTVGESPG